MKKITLLFFVAFFFSMKGNCTTDTLVVTVYGNPASPPQFNSMGYSINRETAEYNVCGPAPSIHIAIIDSGTCHPLNNCNRVFGQFNYFIDPDGDCLYDVNSDYNCRGRAENFFIYRAGDSNAIQHMTHLLDSIDNGHIIIAYSAFPIVYSTMDTSFRNVFQRLGSGLIPTMPDTVPFIFACRKGDAGSIHETIGSLSNDTIGISMTYQCGPTGIDERDVSTFNVYPNPVNDKLHVVFRDEEFRNGHIKIYDVPGNLISEIKNIEENTIIDTQKFSPGIYFIKFESMNHSSTVRFIK